MPMTMPASVACRLAVVSDSPRSSAIGLVMNLKPLSMNRQNTNVNRMIGTAVFGFGADGG